MSMLKTKFLVNSKRHKTGKISFIRSMTALRKNHNVDLDLATAECLAFPSLLNRLETFIILSTRCKCFLRIKILDTLHFSDAFIVCTVYVVI